MGNICRIRGYTPRESDSAGDSELSRYSGGFLFSIISDLVTLVLGHFSIRSFYPEES